MHITVVALAVVVTVDGQLTAPSQAGGMAEPEDSSQVQPPAISRHASARGSGYLVRVAQPHTRLTEPTTTPLVAQVAAKSAETYVVQPGDTVVALAGRFGITPDTILSANGELAGNPDLLKLGQELTILPVSGVLHIVEEGDTLESIVEQYKADMDAVIAYSDNHLSEPYELTPGQRIVLPGGTLPPPSGRRYAPAGSSSGLSTIPATGRFMWPTTGRITQYPWGRHTAIDMGTPTGTPIYAADAGYVTTAGWSNVGYGQYVVIDHGNGYCTLYAHMSAILVKAGQSVPKGEMIGRVGSTGKSTGAHLHFEIRKNGVQQNPLNYLP